MVIAKVIDNLLNEPSLLIILFSELNVEGLLMNIISSSHQKKLCSDLYFWNKNPNFNDKCLFLVDFLIPIPGLK